MDMSRRQFFRVTAGGIAGSSMAALGLAPAAVSAQQVREFKLLANHRDPQHLSVLFGQLRPDHV